MSAARNLLLCAFSVFANQALATDLNGYTAQYECRLGNPNCNVDVAALISQACEQVITATDSLATINGKINGGSRFICVQPGDYTTKGTVTINVSGTPEARKVLRYIGSDGNDPWLQSLGTRATFSRISLSNASDWLVHRLAVNAATSPSQTRGIEFRNASNNILDRVLVYGGGDAYWGNIDFYDNGGSNNTVQNSVSRSCAITSSETYAVHFGGKAENNARIVNSELYDCAKNIMVSETGTPNVPGLILENNDIYWSSAFYTNCTGTFTPSGSCAAGEYVINAKQGGSQANPLRIIQNRIWGARIGDSVYGGQGGEAGLIATSVGGPGTAQPYTGSDWFLIKNNILMDAQQGIVTTGYGTGVRLSNHSIVGNIFYDFRTYGASFGTHALMWSLRENNALYLNTVISSKRTAGSASRGWIVDWEHTNSDWRCNSVIDSDPRYNHGGTQTGSQRDHNAYYGTADSGESQRITKSLDFRVNSTSYSVGDVIRTGPAGSCMTPSDSSCFLYEVTRAGISASSQPTYCTELGCSVADNTVELKAIRGPHSFRRKLRTTVGGEIQVVPYARIHTSAKEAFACPSNFAERPGIGIIN